MQGLNKIVLIGRLCSHPELRTGKSGTAWCNLSVATDRNRKEGDEYKKETDWHHVRVFGRDAERCEQMLRSGSLVSVEGRMTYDKWEDDDGKKRVSPRIIADRVGFLSDLRDRASA